MGWDFRSICFHVLSSPLDWVLDLREERKFTGKKREDQRESRKMDRL